MFGSSKNVPIEEPKLFGAQKERVATNESGRVLPWFLGSRFLGVTWLGNAFDVRTTPIDRKVGKKSQTVGHNYYASCVGLVCCGPCDVVFSLKFDEEEVWDGYLPRGGEDAVPLMTTRGEVILYWGTETQTLNALLEASGQNFSAMRGQTYIILNDVLFGPDRTNAPNIQIGLERNRVKPSWLTTASALVDTDLNGAGHFAGQPMIALYEWWTNPRFGLGYSEDQLDLTRLDAVANTLDSEGMGLDPLITNEMDLRAAVLQLLESIDGYPTSYDGKLGVELIRNSSNVVKRVTKNDLLSDPQITGQTWTETFDETRVKYKNYDRENNDDMVKHHELASFLVNGRHRIQTTDRPWVTSTLVAQKIANALGRRNGAPQVSGSMSLRESKAEGLTVGALFEYVTRDNQVLRLRVKGRTEPPPDRRGVDIEFESDTGWSNDSHFVPTPHVVTERETFEPQESDANRIIDAPYAFADSNPFAKTQQAITRLPTLMYMVSRGDLYSTHYEIWRSTSGTYEPASKTLQRGQLFDSWAVKARLTAAYSASTDIIDESIGISFGVDSTDQSILDDEWDLGDALDHTLLAFIGAEASEIVSLFNVVKTGPNTYTAKCVRALYDTRRRNHGGDSELWIQPRSDVNAFAWPGFIQLPRKYLFQPRFGQGEVQLADLTEVTHTENGRTIWPICPPNLYVDGDGAHPVWNTGSDLEITWENTAREKTVFGVPVNELIGTDLSGVRLEVWTADGATLHNQIDTDADETYTLTNATLVAGVNADFELRIYGVRSGFLSLDYTSVVVDKV